MPGKVNEVKWSKAKAAARKQYGSKVPDDKFYAIVSTIYKNMNGKFKKEANMLGLAKLSAIVKQPPMEYYSDLDIKPDPEFVGYNTRVHPFRRNPERLGGIGQALYSMVYKPGVQEAVLGAERKRKMQSREF
jgi:hypothetical protein